MPPPSEKQFQTAYDLFLDKGLIGAVALLAILALVWAVMRLLKSKDERIQDQAQFAVALKTLNDGVTKLIIEVNKSATEALFQANQGSSALRQKIENLEKTVHDAEDKLDKLRDEQVRLVGALGGSSSPLKPVRRT